MNPVMFACFASFFVPGLALGSLEGAKRRLARETVAVRCGSKAEDPDALEAIVEKWNAHYDVQNLKRDRFKTRNDWRALFPIRERRVHEIEGTRVYYGLFPKRYRYEVLEDPRAQQLVVALRLHYYPSKKLKNPAYALKRIEAKLGQASKIWNEQAPRGVKFDFQQVSRPEDAHYSIKVVDRPSALYDQFVGYYVPDEVVAHEIGHMMGLDDEYSMVHDQWTSFTESMRELLARRKKPASGARPSQKARDCRLVEDLRCNLDSLMCFNRTLYPYHFEHVLGRIPSVTP